MIYLFQCLLSFHVQLRPSVLPFSLCTSVHLSIVFTLVICFAQYKMPPPRSSLKQIKNTGKEHQDQCLFLNSRASLIQDQMRLFELLRSVRDHDMGNNMWIPPPFAEVLNLKELNMEVKEESITHTQPAAL